jgi:hypothetical protein
MNRTTIGQYGKDADGEIKTIHGKKVLVFFTWHNYSPANYRADFKAYKQYLEGIYSMHPDALIGLKTSLKSLPEDKIFLETLEQEIEYDLAKHPIELMDKELISYEEFRKTVEEKFSKIIFELFEQDERLIFEQNDKQMPQDQIYSVEIDVESVKDREWYFMHFFQNDKSLYKLDREKMYFKFSGYWLLHNIVIPACHLPNNETHIEDARVEILQQLKEHQQALEHTLIDDTKLNTEVNEYLTDKDSRNVKYLYRTVKNVRSATLSQFHSEIAVKQRVIIPAGAIQNYRRLLDVLSQQPQNKVSAFYEKYLSYSNTGPCGEYSMGRILGAIAVAAKSEADSIYAGKKEYKPYDLYIDGALIGEKEVKTLKERGALINNAISSGKEIIFKNFDPMIVDDVLNNIRSIKDLNEFIGYAGRIFDIFNITPQNQIFNNDEFNRLVKKANERKNR